MRDEQARAAAETVARGSYGKLVAYLAARTRARRGGGDAFPTPSRPRSRLAVSGIRKARKPGCCGRAPQDDRRGATAAPARRRTRWPDAEELEAAAMSEIPDQRLALMFACAHPAIDAAIRAPLILQTVLGFDAATIASAFLVAPATMGQRLSRAKNKIRQAGVPFRVPERADLRERLDAVLAAIYAAYAEGWSDPDGTEARRRNLSERESGSAASWSRCCRTSPRRSACSP